MSPCKCTPLLALESHSHAAMTHLSVADFQAQWVKLLDEVTVIPGEVRTALKGFSASNAASFARRHLRNLKNVIAEICVENKLASAQTWVPTFLESLEAIMEAKFPGMSDTDLKPKDEDTKNGNNGGLHKVWWCVVVCVVCGVVMCG